MSYFSYHPVEGGFRRRSTPEPRRADLGEFPRLDAALDTVNRDVVATLPDQSPLVLMVCGEDADEQQIYVALSDGRWQGAGLSEPDDDDFDPLDAVADAAQETVMELLWQVWPLCPFHRMGTHVRPEGTKADWEWGKGTGPRLVWWCRGHHGDDCHDLAPVGELADSLPGKQRRELRRSERRERRERREGGAR